jgi:hypothetical protein
LSLRLKQKRSTKSSCSSINLYLPEAFQKIYM